MRRSRLSDADAQAVADELGVPVTEVRRAVDSFFGSIVEAADELRLDNECRIYTRAAFRDKEFACNIPSIGRIGPVYSRYLAWRSNESRSQVQEPRSRYRERVTRDEIDNIASEIIAGRSPAPVTEHKGKEFYKRVWLVDTDKRKLARQVIRKDKENGV